MPTGFRGGKRRLTRYQRGGENGGGQLSGVYYVKVYEGGRRYWKSTRQRNLKLAKQVVDTWRLRDAKGERHLTDPPFARAIDAWLDGKTDPASVAVIGIGAVIEPS